MSMHFLES